MNKQQVKEGVMGGKKLFRDCAVTLEEACAFLYIGHINNWKYQSTYINTGVINYVSIGFHIPKRYRRHS